MLRHFGNTSLRTKYILIAAFGGMCVCSVEVSGGGEDEGVRGFRVLKYSVSCGNRFGLC